MGPRLGGSLLVMLAFGLSASVAFGLQEGGVGAALGRVLPAALVPAPGGVAGGGAGAGRLVVAGRLVHLAWVALVAFLILAAARRAAGPAPLGDRPRRRTATCPGCPCEEMAWPPLVALLGVSAAVVAAAWWRYRGRDIG